MSYLKLRWVKRMTADPNHWARPGVPAPLTTVTMVLQQSRTIRIHTPGTHVKEHEEV